MSLDFQNGFIVGLTAIGKYLYRTIPQKPKNVTIVKIPVPRFDLILPDTGTPVTDAKVLSVITTEVEYSYEVEDI